MARVLGSRASIELLDTTGFLAPEPRGAEAARLRHGHGWRALNGEHFITVEVWTVTGLTRFAVLFVMYLATRRVEIEGIVADPDTAWVIQCGRGVTNADDGFLQGRRFQLHDRDPLFCDGVRETLAAAGAQTVRLPPRLPNLNAYAERFVRTVKESCLDRMILFGERSLRRTIGEFVEHDHHERNHQVVGHQILFPTPATTEGCKSIRYRPRLGGLLKYYSRPAAEERARDGSSITSPTLSSPPSRGGACPERRTPAAESG